MSHDSNNSIIANSTGELLIDSSIISLRDTSNNSRLRIEPAGNVRVEKNLNVVGITTINFSASGAALRIERGSAAAEAIDIDTTATSDASRIRFLESGTSKAEVTYSHDNDQLELIARNGQSADIFTDADQVGVSAQEVLEVCPEAVKPAPIDSNYYTVQYEKLVPLLIEAINGIIDIISMFFSVSSASPIICKICFFGTRFNFSNILT